MPLLSPNILKRALPKCNDPVSWATALNPALEHYAINSKARMAAFLSQIGHESSQFNVLIENLNYSAQRLTKVFPKRFPNLEIAAQYEKNQEKLGNYVYANRMGNGPVASGDGFKFRGRGLIQITGRSNYTTLSTILGVDLIKTPDELLKPALAATSAAWFWASRGLNELADDETDDNDLEDFTAITKRINGGTAGLKERLMLFRAIKAAL